MTLTVTMMTVTLTVTMMTMTLTVTLMTLMTVTVTVTMMTLMTLTLTLMTVMTVTVTIYVFYLSASFLLCHCFTLGHGWTPCSVLLLLNLYIHHPNNQNHRPIHLHRNRHIRSPRSHAFMVMGFK
jgi:hypothetical protein